MEDRSEYLDALDRASIDNDIAPFARFLAERARPVRRVRAPAKGKKQARAKGKKRG